MATKQTGSKVSSKNVEKALALASKYAGSRPVARSAAGFDQWSERQVEYHARTLGYLGTTLSVLVKNAEYIDGSDYVDSSSPNGIANRMYTAVAAIANAIEQIEEVDAALAGTSPEDIESGVLL